MRRAYNLTQAARETNIPEGIVWELVADNPYLTEGGLIPHENLSTLRNLFYETTAEARP